MAATRMKRGRRAVAVVRVQGRGQLTLPAAFRKAVGIKPGDVLLLEERGPGHFEVRVLSRRSLLDFPRVDVAGFDMRSAREEMERALAAEAIETPQNRSNGARREVAVTRDA